MEENSSKMGHRKARYELMVCTELFCLRIAPMTGILGTKY
jgi:hypothetical protein